MGQNNHLSKKTKSRSQRQKDLVSQITNYIALIRKLFDHKTQSLGSLHFDPRTETITKNFDLISELVTHCDYINNLQYITSQLSEIFAHLKESNQCPSDLILNQQKEILQLLDIDIFAHKTNTDHAKPLEHIDYLAEQNSKKIAYARTELSRLNRELAETQNELSSAQKKGQSINETIQNFIFTSEKELNQKKQELEQQYTSFLGELATQAEQTTSQKIFIQLKEKERYYDDQIRKTKKAYKESLEELKRQINDKDAEITHKLEEAGLLVAAASEKAITEEAEKAAQEELEQGKQFRSWALLSCLATLFLIAFLILNKNIQFYNFKEFYKEFLLIVFTVIPFVYCAKESAAHYANARMYKRKSVDLSTIPAYLSPLPKESAENLRIKLAGVYFCDHNKKEEKAPSVSIGFASLKDIIDYIIKAFKK